jgi:SAM-dependent methyltransferase
VSAHYGEAAISVYNRVSREHFTAGSARVRSAPAAAEAPDWPTLREALLGQASEPYRRAGRFAYHFARGKLRHDPVFRAILERGLLRGHTHILDLGCGQGVLAAWLRAASRCYERGQWPRFWPPPPCLRSMRGIELMRREVARARCAFGAGSECEVTQADIRSTAFGTADAVVILDVLHYMPEDSQRDVLRRVRAALPHGGALLLRVGDADAGLRFRLTQWSDHVILLFRGHGLARLHCRGLGRWRELLRECGFDSRPERMSHGTPFANVLLIARAV